MSSPSRAASPVNASAHSGRSHRTSSVLQDSDSVRRHSRLPELLTRKRTSSMPHRKDKDSTPGTSTLLLDAISGSGGFTTVIAAPLCYPTTHNTFPGGLRGQATCTSAVGYDVLIRRLLLFSPVRASPARVLGRRALPSTLSAPDFLRTSRHEPREISSTPVFVVDRLFPERPTLPPPLYIGTYKVLIDANCRPIYSTPIWLSFVCHLRCHGSRSPFGALYVPCVPLFATFKSSGWSTETRAWEPDSSVRHYPAVFALAQQV